MLKYIVGLLLLLGGMHGCFQVAVGQDQDKVEIDRFIRLLQRVQGKDWTYQELEKAADVIVIATFQSSRPERADLYQDDQVDPNSVDVVVSTFKIAAALKGIPKQDSIDVVHFQRRKHPPANLAEGYLGVIDFSGLNPPEFEKSMLLPSVFAVATDGKVTSFTGPISTYTIVPEYMLFLKARDDGKYELVSGGRHGQSSVRILNVR